MKRRTVFIEVVLLVVIMLLCLTGCEDCSCYDREIHCRRCGKYIKTVGLSEYDSNSDWYDHYVCSDCAAKEDNGEQDDPTESADVQSTPLIQTVQETIVGLEYIGNTFYAGHGYYPLSAVIENELGGVTIAVENGSFEFNGEGGTSIHLVNPEDIKDTTDVTVQSFAVFGAVPPTSNDVFVEFSYSFRNINIAPKGGTPGEWKNDDTGEVVVHGKLTDVKEQDGSLIITLTLEVNAANSWSTYVSDGGSFSLAQSGEIGYEGEYPSGTITFAVIMG